MAFKKTLKSNAEIIIAGGDQSKLFPVGFKYVVGSRICTVMEAYNNDNTEFRRLSCLDGAVEDVTVETIQKDFRSAGAKNEVKVLYDPDNVTEEEPKVKKKSKKK